MSTPLFDLLLCHRCGAGIRLTGGNVAILEGVTMRCPFCCSHMLQGHLEKDVAPEVLSIARAYPLTAEEALQAIEGMGFPHQKACQADVVRGLLQTVGVRVGVSDVEGTPRSVVDYLELPCGTRIYLGSSVHGAVVYRIAERRQPSDSWPLGDAPK